MAANTVPPNLKPDTPRHLDAKKHLLERMSKTTGHQTEHHPRHRLLEALRGFSSYTKTQLASIDRLQGLYSHASVSRHQKRLLERTVGYSSKFASVRDRILKNQRLCHAIVLDALDFYRIDQAELDTHAQQMEVAGRAVDKVSVSQALKHIVRDWAARAPVRGTRRFRASSRR